MPSPSTRVTPGGRVLMRRRWLTVVVVVAALIVVGLAAVGENRPWHPFVCFGAW